MNFVRIAALTGAVLGLVGGVTIAATSCSQTPINVPVRTFQQAQKVDFVCIAVNDQYGNPLPANQLTALPQDSCSPVPIYGDTATFANHLYAVVTQTTPGTLGVVDLTNQSGPTSGVVDEDNSTPGINFIPVGALPTDVAIPPDGSMTFVTSAAPDKPAIYGIDSRRLLGNSTGNPPFPPLLLTDLPACALPQTPDALSIAPLPDGGFVLLVMLRATGNAGARIAAYDPGPLLRGAHVPSVAAGAARGDAGPVDPPGGLPACSLLGNTLLAGSSALPAAFQAGPAWPDGVPYRDGGVDLEGAAPSPAPVLEGGASTCSAAPASLDAGILLPVVPPVGALPVAMVLRTDKSLLYVADGAVPLIHVIDVSDPANPREQAPLLATSLRNPGRVIGVGPLAISPATHDFKRYLYAVDESDGTVMVYDVTDPVTSPRVPMQRPHAELNPFIPPDRLSFSAPVATVAFVEHDWLLQSQVDAEHYYSGVLCNPNPNAHPNPTDFLAKGAYYRVDQAATIQNAGVVENFPTRLRGIFGFVTLSNGNVVPIDVDDWDAPCRRPDPMGTGAAKDPQNPKVTYPLAGQTGALSVPEPPPSSPQDLDEYHVPLAYQSSIPESPAVTLESFFPVSAPHRTRSASLLEQDPSGGNHAPYVLATPLFVDQNGAPVAVGSNGQPLLLAPPLDPGFVDPTIITNPTEPNPDGRTIVSLGGSPDGGVPGIRVSFDDPTAHIDQDWVITFEGPLPTAPGAPLDVVTNDGFKTLTLGNGVLLPDGGADAAPPLANGLASPGFCGMGIEDWTIGVTRAQAAGVPGSAGWTADYIEVADDLLLQQDPYWNETGQACWQVAGASLADSASDRSDARFNACANLFGALGTDGGASGVGTYADSYLARDFPIIQAFDDHLVVGRFGWSEHSKGGEQTGNRVIVGSDPSNAPFLALAQCCFHNQATIKVRTGGEWVAVAQNGVGLIHHMQVGAGGSCVLSCNSDDVLKNARALDLSVPSGGDTGCSIAAGQAPSSRNSPSALRNPMFSFYIRPPIGTPSSCPTHTLLQRDESWQFSMRGGYNPLSISLAQGSAAGVSPQSMRFIEPFGQLAVVDGSQQGLVIIDLNTLSFAHNPYY